MKKISPNLYKIRFECTSIKFAHNRTHNKNILNGVEGLYLSFQLGYSSAPQLVLDDCNFHERVSLADFTESRVLSFTAPDGMHIKPHFNHSVQFSGEFVVMNYRISSEFRVPVLVYAYVQELSLFRVIF